MYFISRVADKTNKKNPRVIPLFSSCYLLVHVVLLMCFLLLYFVKVLWQTTMSDWIDFFFSVSNCSSLLTTSLISFSLVKSSCTSRARCRDSPSLLQLVVPWSGGHNWHWTSHTYNFTHRCDQIGNEHIRKTGIFIKYKHIKTTTHVVDGACHGTGPPTRYKWWGWGSTRLCWGMTSALLDTSCPWWVCVLEVIGTQSIYLG